METIISRIEENELDTSPDSRELRLAYAWLMVEKSHKGQKWFLKEYQNKGKVIVKEEKSGLMYWVYESKLTPTLDDTRPTEVNQLRFWAVCNYQAPPYYVRVLREEIPDSRGLGVPRIIRELWEEVKAA